MTDRELIELAAKAAGYELTKYLREDSDGVVEVEKYACWDKSIMRTDWNPLTNDGDALRLAVKLMLCFGPNFDGDMAVCFGLDGNNITESLGNDPYAATRRAIVRAAAEIARDM